MEKLKKINEYWKHITGFIAIIVFIWGIFGYMQGLKNDNKEILDTLQTTQQMALKSVIWNDEIPLTERASACDVYLDAGYNSLTKRECQEVIEKGAKEGIFSYVEESEVR